MQRFTIILTAALFLTVSALAGPACAAKPAPPVKTQKILSELAALEESIEDQDWKEVSEHIDNVESMMKLIAMSSAKAGGPNLLPDFNFMLETFRKSIAQKDKAKASRNHVALQKLLMESLETFDYAVPPAFDFIQAYVKEADEEIEKGRWDEYQHELSEMDMLYKKFKADLPVGRVASADMAAFEKAMTDCKAGATAKSKKDSEAALKQLDAAMKKIRGQLAKK